MRAGKPRPQGPEGLSFGERLTHKRLLARRDLLRVAKLCGRPEGVAPSITDYQQHGHYSVNGVMEVLTGKRQWCPAMKKLGLRSPWDDRFVTEKEAREDLVRVAVLLRRPAQMPTITEYEEYGSYTPATVRRAFQGMGWRTIARHVGLDPLQSRTAETVLVDYRRVAKQLGYTSGGPGPSAKQFEEAAGYTYTAANHYFGGYNALAVAAGFSPRSQALGIAARPESQAA